MPQLGRHQRLEVAVVEHPIAEDLEARQRQSPADTRPGKGAHMDDSQPRRLKRVEVR